MYYSTMNATTILDVVGAQIGTNCVCPKQDKQCIDDDFPHGCVSCLTSKMNNVKIRRCYIT